MPKVKVSHGELDMPDGATRRTLIQNAFLSKVAELVPEVFNDLYDTAKHTYNELRAEYPKEYFARDIERLAIPPMSRERTSPVYTRYPYLTKLIDLMNGWAQRWKLVVSDPNDQWVIRVALGHLEFWDTKGREGEYLALGFGAFGPIPSTLQPPTGLPVYNPILIARADYLSRVHNEASRRIEGDPLLSRIEVSRRNEAIKSIVESEPVLSYCDRVEACFETAGFVRSSEKPSLDKHVEWTARFQVMDYTFSHIAELAEVDNVSSITRPVREILTLIKLKERAGAGPGRKRGSKNRTRLRN